MTTKRRRAPTAPETLAAAVLRILHLEGRSIPHKQAAAMTVDEIIGLIERDHDPIPAALGGSNHPSNLVPRLKAVHREKTAKIDIPMIAKVKRIADKYAEYRRKLLAKDGGVPIAAARLTRKGNRPMPCGRHSEWKRPLGAWNAVRWEKTHGASES
jgi:hypothetical protein